MDWRFICAGIFCVATGFLLPVGLIFIFLGVYSDGSSKYFKEEKKEKTYKIDEYSGEVVENGT